MHRPLLFLLLSLFLTAVQPADCREQYQMNHPPGPPPNSIVQPAGMVHRVNPQDFWKGQIQNRVPAGTVLSGILQQDLHSKKTQRGEVFEILLQDGFGINGSEIIPRNSKILGSVTGVMSATMHRHGHPGRISIALHSLVLPDGSTTPFFGFIDENANLDHRKQQKTGGPGHKIKDWPKTVNTFAGSFTAGIGARMSKRHMGNEFSLEKGEVLPVRLNRSLDVPPMQGQLAAQQTPPGAAAVPPGYPTHPAALQRPPHQQMGFGQPGAYMQQPGAFGQQPGGFNQQPVIPGLAGPDPDAPHPLAHDPNSIFSQPVNPRPLSDLPDPF